MGRANTNGTDIVVKIPKIIFIDFGYNPALTTVNGIPVNNSSWTFDGTSDPINWVFRYSGTLNSFTSTSFGFNGTFNTFGASGVYYMLYTIVNGSGGEWNFNNNTDDERADYFSN